MITLIAHASHWFEGALYLAPVLLLIVVLVWHGRRGDDEADDVLAS